MTTPAPPRRPAGEVVAGIVDPEMPMLTLEELGVIRSVEVDGDAVTVELTPTYSGCPAIEVMRRDIGSALRGAGYRPVEVRLVLSPAWTTDRISEAGRGKLAAAGIAPPASASCPQCGAAVTEVLSRCGPTLCTELRRCPACLEPFEHMRPLRPAAR